MSDKKFLYLQLRYAGSKVGYLSDVGYLVEDVFEAFTFPEEELESVIHSLSCPGLLSLSVFTCGQEHAVFATMVAKFKKERDDFSFRDLQDLIRCVRELSKEN